VNPVESLYDKIAGFMKEYFPAYSDYGQIADTIRVMDRFYAPDLCFDDGVVTSREQWYGRCLAHPSIQDKITLKHLFIDEKQKEVGALCKTQAIDRDTGIVLVELGMNVLYNLKMDKNNDLKISKVKVFLESDPAKAARLFELYAIGSNGPPRTKNKQA
jgi:hypothetical protein